MSSSPLRLDIRPGQDRFLIAAQPIRPGQVFLVDEPHVLYRTSLSCLQHSCSNCFCVVSSQQFSCVSCKVARFCSARCLSRSNPALLCHALPSLIHQPSCQTELLYLLSVYSLNSDSLLQLLSLQYSGKPPPDTLIQDLETQLLALLPRNCIPKHFTHKITSSLLSVDKIYSFPINNPDETAFEECGVEGVRAYELCF